MLVHKCNFLLELLSKTNAYFSRFFCNKDLPYAWVFRSFRTGAGLKSKKCGAGAGWDGLRGAGVGRERARFLKLIRVRGGFKFCGCKAGAGKNFNPRRTLLVVKGQSILFGTWTLYFPFPNRSLLLVVCARMVNLYIFCRQCVISRCSLTMESPKLFCFTTPTKSEVDTDR